MWTSPLHWIKPIHDDTFAIATANVNIPMWLHWTHLLETVSLLLSSLGVNEPLGMHVLPYKKNTIRARVANR